jgi:putative ABC transport system substrate-binding protein
MRGRDVIAALGGAVAVGGWSTAGDAQSESRPVSQFPVPAIGFLSVRSPDDAVTDAEAFRAGLLQAGYAEGRNEYRWGNGGLR